MRFSEEEIKKLERELFSHGITWNEFEEHYQARKWYELPASEVTRLAVSDIEPKNNTLAQLCTKLFAFPECALDTLQEAKLNVLKDFIFEAFGKVRGMSKWEKADFVQYAFKRFSERYAEKSEVEDEVFGVWHESENEFHGVIDFEIKKLPEIKTLDEALIKIKASATHSEIYSTLASCDLSVQTELFRWCWPNLYDDYTRPGLSKRPFEDKVSAVTSFMLGFDEVVWAYLTDKHETPKVFDLLKNFINGEIKKIYSSFFNEPETQEKQLKFWQEQEEKLLNSENPDEHWEEITEIRQIMADLENKNVAEQREILEKCTEAFLWDMCRAYGVTPNDCKKIMAQRIINCHATTAEKIQILEQILPDVRIAFNCWTDNGKLSVNEAYEQSLRRLEAWLIFLLRKEKKS